MGIDHSIKVLYPFEEQRHQQFKNEYTILTTLKKKFNDNPVDYGVVELFDYRDAEWKYDNNTVIGMCTIVVYTYGKPLYPILTKNLFIKNFKLVFLYFSLMVSSSNVIPYIFLSFN